MNNQPLVTLVLKAVALGMSVAVVVLSIVKTGTAETLTTLIGIALLALSTLAFQVKSQ